MYLVKDRKKRHTTANKKVTTLKQRKETLYTLATETEEAVLHGNMRDLYNQEEKKNSAIFQISFFLSK